MADQKPLSDKQIREMLEDLNKSVTEIGLTVETLRRLLESKGYLTEAELSASFSEVLADARATFDRARNAGPQCVETS
jgi:hypothetical protein